MARRRRVLLWISLCVSIVAGGYSATSFIYYSWRESAVWSFVAMSLALLSVCVFVYCLVALIREANRAYRDERNAT